MRRAPENAAEDRFAGARLDMVRCQLAERGIQDPRTLDAFRKVHRHLFVPESNLSEAYGDHPVHIGYGQTISQPYIVAVMTESLGLKGDERVLEIGTGSGYQTAILAELAAKVYTVERIPELASRAVRTLESLGYTNVESVVADGTLGLPEHAPYDAILVAAAAPAVPKSLTSQLASPGRLVIPVGEHYGQTLMLVTRTGKNVVTDDLGPVVFVRLIGREGFQET